MTYNSTVILKGIQKPLYCSKLNAEQLQRILTDNTISPDFIVSVGNQSFRKCDIKFIEVNNDGDDSRSMDAYMKEFYEEERRNRYSLVSKSPEDKSREIGMFSYLYKIITNDEPSQEILEKAVKTQLEFFKNNPRRTICDLDILKKEIKKIEYNSNNDQYKDTGILLKNAYLNFVEKAVYRDMQLSGQISNTLR